MCFKPMGITEGLLCMFSSVQFSSVAQLCLTLCGRLQSLGSQTVGHKWATNTHSICEVKVAQLYLILCNHIDCSLSASYVLGILQARILEWIAISFFRGSCLPRDRTRVSRIGGRCFTLWATRDVLKHASNDIFLAKNYVTAAYCLPDNSKTLILVIESLRGFSFTKCSLVIPTSPLHSFS